MPHFLISIPRTLMLALAVALAVACQSWATGGGKPSTPIEITIAPQGKPQRGAVGEFVVTATALADSDDFSLDVDLPEGLALYSGDLHQKGSVRAGTRFRLIFSIRVPETGSHVITATARMRLSTGSFEEHARYLLGGNGEPAPEENWGRPTERNGERVREYPLP